MNNQLTILIPTSPIPRHPSTAILDETIANLRMYTDAKIIILFDGIHSSLSHREQDYKNYLEAVGAKMYNKEYGDCEARLFVEHTHQAMMVKEVLKEIITPLIFFVEHDCSPIGDIPFKEICDLVEKSYEINYVRFNIFHETPKDHDYLMLDKEPVEIEGVRLVRTIQFSARPNIAKTNWYRNILYDYFKPGQKSMIEDVMHSVVIEKYKFYGGDIMGLAVYAPIGNQLRSYHSDGRGSDTKIIDG
jgi:hypothetical protein